MHSWIMTDAAAAYRSWLSRRLHATAQADAAAGDLADPSTGRGCSQQVATCLWMRPRNHACIRMYSRVSGNLMHTQFWQAYTHRKHMHVHDRYSTAAVAAHAQQPSHVAAPTPALQNQHRSACLVHACIPLCCGHLYRYRPLRVCHFPVHHVQTFPWVLRGLAGRPPGGGEHRRPSGCLCLGPRVLVNVSVTT